MVIMVNVEEIRAFKKPPVPAGAVLGNGASPAAWQKILDRTLIAWSRDPRELEDDGLRAPTSEILALAGEFAMFCQRQGMAAPLRVVPDGAGGIAFEWKMAPSFVTVEIHADGRMEMMRFHNSKLVSRELIG
jgi:hypothetical protein